MSAELKKIQARAFYFTKVREYFADRNVIEVDVPALCPYPCIDENIQVMQVEDIGYLHTSPEYGLKKLIAKVQKDLYQMSHVFRKQETGALHNPEFTMVEWYRLSMDFFAFIQEVTSFCKIFLGSLQTQLLSYDQALLTFADLDATAQNALFEQALQQHGICYAKNLDLQDLVWTHIVEPNLGKEGFTVIYDYPPDQAALAKTYTKDQKTYARRFEIYYQGVELANGYDELIDGKILLDRLLEESLLYEKTYHKKLPVDPELIQAMDTFPDCCGVAVGFDRLVMLATKQKQLDLVQSNFIDMKHCRLKDN